MTAILGFDAAWTACEPAAPVTIDMPVSTVPILGRRTADRQVSRTFEAQWGSAHSPSLLPRAADIGSLSALEPLEDAIDAPVFCWVGVGSRAGRCRPLGDDTAAIWCPRA